MLVGNWCSWDISVVDLREGREVDRIPAGVAPRGIAFSPNGRRAYVALVGEDRVLVIDMRSRRVVDDIRGVGERPRHLVMSPGGRYLYITSEGKDKPQPRGRAHLQVRPSPRSAWWPPASPSWSRARRSSRTTVAPSTSWTTTPARIVKLATDDLATLQDRYLGFHPIGVTYDIPSDKLWVAGYGGQVWVLKDR